MARQSRGAGEALPLDHLDQRGAVQAEQAGRLVLVPAGARERLADEIVLERLDGAAKIEAAVGELVGGALLRSQTADARRKVGDLDDGAGAQDDGALDDVL